MRNIDFSSWGALLSTVIGLALVTLMMVGIRLLVMQTVQQRRERENWQINERLRTLIAAYKTLGGSFTGTLSVSPAHLRDLRTAAESAGATDAPTEALIAASVEAASMPVVADSPGAERRRRVRDAVEAALSDVILLGTEEQVRLAVAAATDLAQGHPVETAEIVVSLRNFIRDVLDIDPVPAGLSVPRQGPTRPAAGGYRGGGGKSAQDLTGGRGGRAGGGQGGAGGGMGMGMGIGAGAAHAGEHHAGDDALPR
ncbi:MAG: hypothetical protein ABI281_03310 [Caldimonas sp.]